MKTASSTDPDGITVTYAYNGEGDLTATNRPMPGGLQQITSTTSDVITDPDIGTAHRTTRTLNGVLISTSLRSADGYLSKSINHLAANSVTTTARTVPNDGAWTETSTSPDGTKSHAVYSNGLLTSSSSLNTENLPLANSTTTYDTFNRALTQTDSRTGTTTMGAYLENGALTSVTEPGGRTTAFTYDKMGRTLTVDAPDTLDADGNTLTNITRTSYTARGEVAGTWGGQTNPTFRVYDSLGRMVELRTYQTLPQGTEPVEATGGHAKTTWQYSAARGFLLAKRDAANKGATYTYTAAGRLATRTWGRSSVALPSITAYTYEAGMMVSTDYSDTTPGVALTYDNFGRVTSSSTLITDHSAPITSSTFAYDPATLALDTETIAYDLDTDGTPELTRVLDRTQDNLQRDTGWQLKNGATVENSVTYDYHTTDGRPASISGGGLHPPSQFTYGYEPNSHGLLKTITGPAHTVTNLWESTRDILESKQNKVGTTTVSGYLYGVNAIGQRTNVAKTGTAFGSVRDITWGYNSKGEVVKADHTLPGLDRAYVFDDIGNRLKSAEGTTDPEDTTAKLYTPNALNQYSQITNNSITNNPAFDADGNMTAGPLPANVNANSTLVWDGENRLIEAQVTSGATVNYVYDSQSRRIAETVGAATKITVYDGWNPIAEYSISNNQYSISKSFTWGIDLSGSLQGAGGVGGLLAVTDSTGTYFPTFDGNGNASEYLDSTGAVVAHYEYDPFGRTTVATGSKANDFAHRFSTKPLDATTGLYYYGYRYYDPATGRWPSRDPIGERGGINLYAFVGNDGVNAWDYLGFKISIIGSGSPKDPNYTPGTDKDLLETLKKLRECCPEIAKYWDELEKSENHHIIENKTRRTNATPRGGEDGWEKASNGTGTGTYINLSGQAGQYTLGDGPKDPITSLAHELQHAYDIDRGSLDKRGEEGSGGVAKNEENAVRAENVCRKKLGLPIRTTYGGKKVDNPEAEPK